MHEPIVILTAKIIRTMDATVPTATAIAVRGDKIVALGDTDELVSAYAGAEVDDRYADAVLTAGFVEAHAHVAGGFMGSPNYVGFFPRMAPDGSTLAGLTTIDAVLDKLRQIAAALPQGAPVFARGLDMLFFPREACERDELDAVAADRPVVVLHASGHVVTVNSVGLAAAGFDESTAIDGVVKDANGRPTGELREFAAMAPVLASVGGGLGGNSAADIYDHARDARNHGCTTVTDLANTDVMTEEGLSTFKAATEAEDFPARLVPFMFAAMAHTVSAATEAAERAVTLRGHTTPKLQLGAVKLMLDGSIQQHTACLLEPGYLSGQTEGIWNVQPEFFVEQLRPFYERGVLVHTHCNGDAATEVFVDAVEALMRDKPSANHRYTVTHSQLTTAAQYARMGALGMCANIFSNHIWYWGDQHIDYTVGLDRVKRMNAPRSALNAGVPITLHCDTPVTPLDPLATASYAVDRLTPTGRSWGGAERLSVAEALGAITLGAAYTLKLDHLIGSLAPGKYADLAVLDTDPYEASNGEDLRAITVLGTVVGGVHFPSPAAS